MRTFKDVSCMVCSLLAVLNIAAAKFAVDYENNQFLLDGKPFQYVSGSAHYFRTPNQYWRDRLRKLKAAGLNAVSTYVEWSQHEPVPGIYDFEGDLDLLRYIQIAEEEGLYVILRPGPYICAERDMGGFPYWLLRDSPTIKLRTMDPQYTKPVKRWMDLLLQKVTPYLYGNGGPIIMVQVENEYGLYHACDHEYNIWLRDLFQSHVKDNAVLFTTDPYGGLKCGKIPNVLSTIDFGPEVDVKKAFSEWRKIEPKGPLVNSEYYTGWLTHWGEKMASKKPEDVAKTLEVMLKMRVNVNFYMFFGGTNFGFTAGSNTFSNKYISDITSYDYDAPISEAGDVNEKYFILKEVIEKYVTGSNITIKNSGKGDYGEHQLELAATLLSPHIRQTMGVRHESMYPQTFEELDQNQGYMLYETDLRKNITSPKEYVIEKFHDFANVYVDGTHVVSLSREYKENKFVLESSTDGQKLSIVVENLGRINFDSQIQERKGILSNVTKSGKVMDTWRMTSFELKDVTPILECFEKKNQECINGQGFHFYVKKFALPENAEKTEGKYFLDSFLDVSHLSKGLVFVNGFNLGRYWSRGPQYTLYVPGVYLRAHPEENTLIVMEESVHSKGISVKFTKTPILKY